jgi:hypothetical protein
MTIEAIGAEKPTVPLYQSRTEPQVYETRTGNIRSKKRKKNDPALE